MPPFAVRRLRIPSVALAALTVCGVGAAVGTPMAAAAQTCASQGLSIQPLQSDVFYIDTATSYLGSYVGHRVKNTGATARTDLWERLESFSGGALAPAAGGATTAASPVASLAANGSAPSYSYVKAPAPTATVQHFDVVVYHGRPGAGGTEVCREPQTITSVEDVIKAAANKVDAVSMGSAKASLGGSFSFSVSGQTGTIGAGIASDPGIVRFSPAVADNWPSSAFQLVGVSTEFPTGSLASPDVLSLSGMSGASRSYKITYAFRVVGPTSSTTPVVPVQNIASGTQVKHTDPSSLGALPPIPQVTSDAHVSVTAAPAGPFAAGDTVGLTATVTNAGDSPVSLDELLLHLPGTWAAVPGTTQLGGTSLPDPYDAGGGDLHVVGPFTVPAGGSQTLSFDAKAGTAGSTGSFTALGTLVGGQIDATTDPADNSPAAVSLTVMGSPSAVNDSFTAVAGAATSLDVLANDDLAGGTPQLTIAVPPTHGTVAVVNGRLSYTPTAGYSGPDTLVYKLTTGGGSAQASVALTVQAPPAAPSPANLTSTGVGVAPQSKTLTVPSGATARLVKPDGTLGTSVTRSGQGTYDLDPATSVVTFTPELGFSGVAAPVTYRLTDSYGQHGDATYTPTVTKPAAPSAPSKSSTGVGTAEQAVTLTIPTGGAVTLLDAGQPASSISVPGQGTYTLDPATGRVRFAPVPGYQGTANGVSYEVTDAYGQTARATYTPTVTPPAAPTPANKVSTGVGMAPQSVNLPTPAGGSVRLLDAQGNPATTVTKPGQGTYVLDPQSGVVTFTPVAGYRGVADGVSYRVTDAYGQHGDATYVPTVQTPPAPSPGAKTSTGVGVAEQWQILSAPQGGTVALLDASGQPATTVTVPGEGTYVLDPGTGKVTFTPVLGFQGAAAGLRYEVTDAYGQTGRATYTPAVTPPAAPKPDGLASSAVGVTPQAAALPVPSGGTVRLLDATGAPVTKVVLPGQGAYELDPTTGVVTFTAVFGWAGVPAPVTYEVTDAYGQRARAEYQPAVTAPPAADAPTQTSTGDPDATQSQVIAIPKGGTVTLLDPAGHPATQVDVPGVGTYVLDPATGTVTFTPAVGFFGTPAGVPYEVTDAYGQRRKATYVPTVVARAAAPAAARPAAAAVPAPSPHVCISRRNQLLHFKLPKHARVRRLVVTVNGRAYPALKPSARKALIVLKGMPAQTVVVVVRGQLADGRLLQATRVYRTCRRELKHPPLGTLKLR